MFFNTDHLNDGEIYLRLKRTSDENAEKGYVPAYFFEIMRVCDNEVLGDCDLRIGYNDNTYYGGNIGYGVSEKFRGNHYAGKACKQLIRLAKQHNMKSIVITCDPDNYASRKTCEYVGGKLEKIVNIPEWHEMYQMGKRQTCRYIVEIINENCCNKL